MVKLHAVFAPVTMTRLRVLKRVVSGGAIATPSGTSDYDPLEGIETANQVHTVDLVAQHQ